MAYQPPAVAYGLLPDNAAALSAGMSAQMPNGLNSPICLALGGAILAGIQQTQGNPGDTSAIVLVTDGPASGCGDVNPDDPAASAMLATAGAGPTPSVKTFVIGLPGVNAAIANQIAAAGGTGSAILVTAINVSAEFQAALAKVRAQAQTCQYDLPSEETTGQVDAGHVDVLITPGGGNAAILPPDPSCTGDGWRYDDPTAPTHVVLCPSSCAALRTDAGATVQLRLGCATTVAQ